MADATAISNLAERLRLLEIQVVTLVAEMRGHDSKVTDLKTSVTGEFKDVEGRIDKLDEAKNKMTWLVISFVVAAALKFIFDGKLGVA